MRIRRQLDAIRAYGRIDSVHVPNQVPREAGVGDHAVRQTDQPAVVLPQTALQVVFQRPVPELPGALVGGHWWREVTLEEARRPVVAEVGARRVQMEQGTGSEGGAA